VRIALVIVVLTAIAVGLVELRRQEVVCQHEIHKLAMELRSRRQESQALDVRLGALTAVEALRTRAQEMGLSLEGPVSTPAGAHSATAETTND
jgi:cell division protein FtsL